jgi:hypothetical protein
MKFRSCLPERHSTFTAGRCELFIFVICRPTAYFFSILIDQPHRLRRDLLNGAANHNRLRLRMFGAIKAPYPGMSQAAKIVDMRLARPEWKSLEDFGRAGSAPGPNILDEAVSGSRVHRSHPPCRGDLIFDSKKSRGELRKIRGLRVSLRPGPR